MSVLDIKLFLPFFIPLMIVQICLLIYALHHILTHDHYKHGSRTLWLIVVIVGMAMIGPVLYIFIGKEDM